MKIFLKYISLYQKYFYICNLNFKKMELTTVQVYNIRKLYDNTYIIGCKFYKI